MDCYILNLSTNAQIPLQYFTPGLWVENLAAPTYNPVELATNERPQQYTGQPPDSLQVEVWLGTGAASVESNIQALSRLREPEAETGEPPNVAFVCGSFRWGTAKVSEIGTISTGSILDNGERSKARLTLTFTRNHPAKVEIQTFTAPTRPPIAAQSTATNTTAQTPTGGGGGASVATSDALDYLFEIALGTEFGNSAPVVRKWAAPVRLRVYGEPSESDRATVMQVAQELTQLTGLSTTVVETGENVSVFYIPRQQFTAILPKAPPGNEGIFWFTGMSGHTISGVTILINSTQQPIYRNHLLREELTQSFGLPRDSTRYADSIFYQAWTATQTYSPIDKAVIQLLYDSRITPGMGKEEIRRAIAA